MEISCFEQLKKKSQEMRRNIVEMCIKHGGHITSSMSCVDILVSLYHGGILASSTDSSSDPQRDRFILSKGHAEAALYAVLEDRGFISHDLVESSYRHGDCQLGGHPSYKINGVEWSTGSLGHGLSVAAGQAIAARLDGSDRHHFVLLGDSECTEGSVWEAALFASAQKLSNLTVIIDRNHLGVLESTESFTSLTSIKDKWEAFNWRVLTCDGHNIEELCTVLRETRENKVDAPTAIVAQTVKGKGIPFMENVALWHVKALNKPEEIALARQALSEE